MLSSVYQARRGLKGAAVLLFRRVREMNSAAAVAQGPLLDRGLDGFKREKM
jgi:hypothetical protein